MFDESNFIAVHTFLRKQKQIPTSANPDNVKYRTYLFFKKKKKGHFARIHVIMKCKVTDKVCLKKNKNYRLLHNSQPFLIFIFFLVIMKKVIKSSSLESQEKDCK